MSGKTALATQIVIVEAVSGCVVESPTAVSVVSDRIFQPDTRPAAYHDGQPIRLGDKENEH